MLLKEIAGGRHMTLSDLVGAIDAQRQHGNLSSALRLFVLDFYRSQVSEKDSRDGIHDLMARPASAFSSTRRPRRVSPRETRHDRAR